MAQSIDISQLIEFNKKLSDVLKKKEIRKCFKEAHRIVGKEMERMVRSGLPGSRKVARWQVARFGDGGGYAAVSADQGRHEGYAKGYITNAIENGHWTRPRSRGGSHGYHKNGGARNLRVKGLKFYFEARSELKRNAQKHAETLEHKLNDVLQNLGR